MLSENLSQRLNWLDPNKYKITQQLILEEEKQKPDNYAKIIFETKQKELLYFKGEEADLNCLKQRKTADAIIFAFSSVETHLHIIECKTTVTYKIWEETIKEQFEGALLRALAIHRLLNLAELTKIKFYTAYRNDKITLSPSIIKLGCDWIDDSINILSLKKIGHQKILLDNKTGLASDLIILDAI